MIAVTTLESVATADPIDSGGDSGATGFSAALAAVETPQAATSSPQTDEVAADRRSSSVAWTSGIGRDRPAARAGQQQGGSAVAQRRAEGTGTEPAEPSVEPGASAADDFAALSAESDSASSGDEGAGSDASETSQIAGAQQNQSTVSSSADSQSTAEAVAAALPDELSPVLAKLAGGTGSAAVGVRVTIDGLGSITARARLHDGTVQLTLSADDPGTAAALAGSLDQLRDALSQQLGGLGVQLQLDSGGTGTGPGAGSDRLSPEGGVSAANSVAAAARQSVSEPARESATIAHGTGIDILA